MIWMHVGNWGEVGEKCPKLIANETLYQLSYSPNVLWICWQSQICQRAHYVLVQGWGKLIRRSLETFAKGHAKRKLAEFRR